MLRILIGVLVAVFTFSPLTILAQEPAPDAVLPFPGITGSQVTGNLQCFDHYKFGSVQADLQPTIASTVPGAELTFSGNITNEIHIRSLTKPCL